jgi:hypothetical protein
MRTYNLSWCSKCRSILEASDFFSFDSGCSRNSQRHVRIAWSFHNNCSAYCKRCSTANTIKVIDRHSDAKALLISVMSRVKNKKNQPISVNLTEAYMQFLLDQCDYTCPYLGIKMNRHKERNEDGSSTYRRGTLHLDSICVDRIIPEKWYVIGNVVLCSRWANSLKWNYSEELLLSNPVTRELGLKLGEVKKMVRNQTEEWNKRNR